MFVQQLLPRVRSVPPLRLLVAAALLGAAAPAPANLSAAGRAWLPDAFAQAARGNRPLTAAPDATAALLADWDRLRREESPASLGELQGFVAANPSWPGVSAMRRRAERLAADPLRTPPGDARAYFAALPPESAAGRARLALLLADAGQTAAALDAARAAWRSAGLDALTETTLLGRFPGLTRDDHLLRAEALLWAGQTAAARRMLPLLPDDRRALAAARIALLANEADAEARAAEVPAALAGDPGLIFDRVNWLQRRGRAVEARDGMAAALPTPAGVADPEDWLKERLELGRAAMRDGQHALAYRLLADHGAFPLGRLLSERTLAQRGPYTDAEWLAGWIALRRLNRPADALRNFQNFRAAVLTPVSRARGDYWIGRAHDAMGDAAGARAAFEAAAAHPDFFYGQLAAERLGRGPALPQVAPPPVGEAERAAFEADGLTRAARALGDIGDRGRQSLFLRALADAAETPAQARLATDLGRALNRPDLAVRVGRQARSDGALGLLDAAHPRLDTAALPAGVWTLSHAIARQESFFDRTAESSVGARGLMQLMPGTAADVARRLGLPYDRQRLFDDPAYNLTLGSDYIGQRVRDFDGNPMLAIAAYNAGAGNVRRWLRANGDPRDRPMEEVVDWIEMIPFQETRNYVQRVVENAVVYSLLEPRRADARPRATDWLGAGR